MVKPLNADRWIAVIQKGGEIADCQIVRESPQFNRSLPQGFNYFAALLDAAEFNARNCTRPTPKPPIAPASSPNNTSSGMLSKNDFFPDFAILCLHKDSSRRLLFLF